MAQRAIDLKVLGAQNLMAEILGDDAPTGVLEDLLRRGAERGDSVAACNLGVLLHNAGRDTESAEAYRVSIELGGTTPALTNLALLLTDQGDLNGARQLLTKAIELGDPHAAEALAELADDA